jgi:hypothetical protein
VSNVTIASATPGLEPGDTAIVRFDAASASGLFRTRVSVEAGCFRAVSTLLALQTSAQVEVRVPVPLTCPRNVPLRVGVTVTDAALREGTTTITGPALVDATPPGFQYGGTLAAGDLFARDTLVRDVIVSDDVALGWVKWEWIGSGARDSVALVGSHIPLRLRIPVPNAAVGRPQLRVTVVDCAGNTTTAFTSAPNSIRVLPTLDRPVTSVTIPGELRGLLLDERRGRILVLQSAARRLLVLDRNTLVTVHTIALPDVARLMDLTAGGDSVIVALATPALLGIVDLRPATPVVTTLAMTGIDSLPGRIASHLAATSRGTVMVITTSSNGLSDARLVETTLATGATRVRSDAPVAPGFTLISRSPDASVVAFARIGCLRRWTAATDTFDACRALTGDDAVTWSADGRIASLSRLVLDENFSQILMAEAPNGTFYPKTQLSADGSMLLIRMESGGVARSRTSDGMLVDRLAMPAHVIRPWSDGSAIVSATGYQADTTRVYVIDPR